MLSLERGMISSSEFGRGTRGVWSEGLLPGKPKPTPGGPGGRPGAGGPGARPGGFGGGGGGGFGRGPRCTQEGTCAIGFS